MHLPFRFFHPQFVLQFRITYFHLLEYQIFGYEVLSIRKLTNFAHWEYMHLNLKGWKLKAREVSEIYCDIKMMRIMEGSSGEEE